MFFSRKKGIDQAIGIDIGSSAIKMVQLKKEHEKIILETYGEIELGPYAGLEPGQAAHLGDEKLVEALEDLFKASKVTSREATIAIDSSAVFVSLVSVPQVSDDELRTMMPLEARKYLPFPLTEVQMDWWKIPGFIGAEKDDHTLQVVLAAVKNDTLAMYDRISQKCNLTHPEFEIEGFSLLRSSLFGVRGMVLVLDIGAQYSTTSLIKDGVVIDMHVMSRGSQDSTIQLSKALSLPITEAEKIKREFGYHGDTANPYVKDVMQLSSYPLFGEVARLSLMYERKYNQNIEGVIISGGGARVPGILDAYKEAMHIPGRLAVPFEQVDVPEFLREMVTRIGPSYSVAVGCALKKILSQ